MAKNQGPRRSDEERKQVKLWMKEKSAAVLEAENTSTFKIESLTNNFRNRQRSLEQKMLDTTSESIRRMYTQVSLSPQWKHMMLS